MRSGKAQGRMMMTSKRKVKNPAFGCSDTKIFAARVMRFWLAGVTASSAAARDLRALTSTGRYSEDTRTVRLTPDSGACPPALADSRTFGRRRRVPLHHSPRKDG